MTDAGSRFLIRRLRRLARYRPALEGRMDFGLWAGGERLADGSIQMPWFAFSDEAQAFIQSLYEAEWVQPFDWMAWLSTPEGRRLMSDRSEVEAASTEQLTRLVTALVRQDRFAEGALAAAYESGMLAAIARRAEELAADLDFDNAIGSWADRPWKVRWSGEVVAAATQITEIGLSRGMCYGPCPVYAVRFFSDGRAEFTGEHFVNLLGEHRAHVDVADFELLTLALAHLRFGNLRRNYAVDHTDADTSTVWIVRRGRRRTVDDYGGAGPQRLRQIEALIDDAAAELHWLPSADPALDDLTPTFEKPADDSWRPGADDDLPTHWTQSGEKRLEPD